MSGVRRAIPRRPAAASWMSWDVTTLFLGLLLGLVLGWRRLVLVLVDLLVLVFLHDARHIHDEVAGRQVHDLHALRVAAGNADPLDRHADHDSLLRDHH